MFSSFDVIKNCIAEDKVEKFSIILDYWYKMTNPDKLNISSFLKKLPHKKITELADQISIYNEYIGKELKVFSNIKENKNNKKIIKKPDIENKAKILGDLYKALKRNGITDEETIRDILITELKTSINYDS